MTAVSKSISPRRKPSLPFLKSAFAICPWHEVNKKALPGKKTVRTQERQSGSCFARCYGRRPDHNDARLSAKGGKSTKGKREKEGRSGSLKVDSSPRGCFEQCHLRFTSDGAPSTLRRVTRSGLDLPGATQRRKSTKIVPVADVIHGRNGKRFHFLEGRNQTSNDHSHKIRGRSSAPWEFGCLSKSAVTLPSTSAAESKNPPRVEFPAGFVIEWVLLFWQFIGVE